MEGARRSPFLALATPAGRFGSGDAYLRNISLSLALMDVGADKLRPGVRVLRLRLRGFAGGVGKHCRRRGAIWLW